MPAARQRGEFANTTFSSNVEDLVRAAAMLRDRYQPASLLVGHSLGGAAMLAAAQQIPDAAAVATIGAPFDPAHIRHLFPSDTLDLLDRSGVADVVLAGRTFRVRRSLLDDADAHNLERALGAAEARDDPAITSRTARSLDVCRSIRVGSHLPVAGS